MLEQVESVRMRGEHAGCDIELEMNKTANWNVTVRQQKPYCFVSATVPDRANAEDVAEILAVYFAGLKEPKP